MQDLLKKLLFGNAGGSNGGAPSLNLSFVDGGTFDPRITFSRGTNATLTGSNGLIQWAPHNLLTNSEDFEAAAWIKAGSSITANTTTAPDATTTGDKLVENAAFAEHMVYVSSLGTGQKTGSVYLKAAERTRAFIYFFNATDGVVSSFFDLSAGTVTAGAGTITPVGNGWYRCTLTRTATASDAMYIGSAIASGASSYTGDGTSGIFIWGAQLNVGALQSYNSTTPKNLLGFTQEPENAAWTKSNSYVQQNLLTWSQDFDNAAWVKTTDGGITVSANTIVAPDGTLTADKFIPNAVAGFHAAQQTYVFPNTAHSFSFYAKAGEYSAVQIFDGPTTDFVNFNLLTGQVGSSLGYTGAITSVGDGWYRCTGTKTFAAASAAIRIGVVTSSTAVRGESFTGNGTDGVFIWGAQLVQGSTAGDYTQTTSAEAPTRYTNWDGTLTGRKLVETTAASTHHRIVQGGTFVIGARYTNSVYAKAGERSIISIRIDNLANAFAWFNLATGTVGTVQSAITAAITSVGGGWYRCSITGTATLTNHGTEVYICDADNSVTYTGDGTSGIYVSDFQIANSASVDPYVYNPQAAAASAAFYGPRFDYNPTGTPVLSGVELVTNGTFATDTSWSKGTGWTINAGEALATASPSGTNLNQIVTGYVTGRLYQHTFTVVSISGGGFAARFEGQIGTTRSVPGTYTEYFFATGVTQNAGVRTIGTTTGAVDNVSVQEVTGYTATANGLLIEEQRTNLLTYSEDLTNAAWSTAGGAANVSGNVAVAPDGTTTADKIVSTVATSYGVKTPIFTSTAAAHTQSAFCKADGFNYVKFVWSSAQNATDYAVFNLSNGTVTGGVYTSASITAFGNGWYRCSITSTLAAVSTSSNIWMSDGTVSRSSGVAGDGTSGILVWGAQVELGSFPTSYIPTVASQVTRNADSASMLGDNFYTWFNPNQGTLSAEGGGQNYVSSARIASISDGTFNNRICTLLNSQTSIGGLITAGGSSQANITGSVASSASSNKIALGYAVDNVNIAVNGASGTLDTSASIPAVNLLRVGSGETGTTSFINGTIRSIRYYTVRLPDATLQQITS